MNRAKTIEKIKILEEQKRRIKYNQLQFYAPYPKQIEFHAASGIPEVTERMLGAGTQCGKTYAGSREAAYHLTGQYPDWWEGARFDKPTVGWVCGVTGKALRDSLQILLLGNIESEESDGKSKGTGSIPLDCILKIKKAQGVPGLADTVLVKHVSGGTSKVTFKTYSEGREPFQSATIDWIWFDEEPPEEIYNEGLARTNNGQLSQFLIITFTPLKGLTTVANNFYTTARPHPQKNLTIMTIYDVDHYTDTEKKSIVASYSENEREARSKGIPTVGEGRVFLTPEDDIKHNKSKDDFPRWWPAIIGMDFGYGQSDSSHPSALVFMRWDRDTNTTYIYDAFYVNKPTPITVAGAIRQRHQHDIDWIPVAWPHDAMKASGGNEKGTVASLHAKQGMNMLHERAKFEDGGNSVEAGILIMQEGFESGTIKVAAHLEEFFNEYRMYHREKGQIVKLRDDMMSAARYGIMCLRYAQIEPDDDDDDDYEQNFEGYSPTG